MSETGQRVLLRAGDGVDDRQVKGKSYSQHRGSACEDRRQWRDQVGARGDGPTLNEIVGTAVSADPSPTLASLKALSSITSEQTTRSPSHLRVCEQCSLQRTSQDQEHWSLDRRPQVQRSGSTRILTHSVVRYRVPETFTYSGRFISGTTRGSLRTNLNSGFEQQGCWSQQPTVRLFLTPQPTIAPAPALLPPSTSNSRSSHPC